MLRAAFEARMAHVPVPADIEQMPTTVGGVPGIAVAVNGTISGNVILYFHGGVYVIGLAKSSVALEGDLARRAGARAVTPDYRLAPEHPYPAAVDDALAAYEGLLQQGIDPGRIALAGESAAGGLAVATLLTLKAAGRPMPSCAFLMSPYADLTLSGETRQRKRRSTRYSRPLTSGFGFRTTSLAAMLPTPESARCSAISADSRRC